MERSVTVEVFEEFLLLPGNMLTEAVAKPGTEISVGELDFGGDAGVCTVKHACLMHHYPVHAPSQGEPYTAVWWLQKKKFKQPFPPKQLLALKK